MEVEFTLPGQYKIAYFGSDPAHMEQIKSRFQKTYQQLKMDFTQYEEITKDNFAESFFEVYFRRHVIIYIEAWDTSDWVTMFCLAIKNTKALSGSAVVLIIEGKEQLPTYRNSKADIFHVKGGEYHDLIYHPVHIVYNGTPPPPPFANAQFEKESSILETIRLGFVGKNYLHVEGDFSVNTGDVIELENELPERINRSNFFTIKEDYTDNIIYPYKKAYDLSPVYLDAPVAPTEEELEEKEPEEIEKLNKKFEERKKEYPERLNEIKDSWRKWHEKQAAFSEGKSLKIMIVDPEMTIIKAELPHYEKSKTSIRYFDLLSENLDELHQFHPHLIVFQFPRTSKQDECAENEEEYSIALEPTHFPGEKDGLRDHSEIEKYKKLAELRAKELEYEKNITAMINGSIQYILSSKNYAPFILMFNCHRYSSESFQQSCGYKFVMANQAMIDFKAIFDMGKMLTLKKEKQINDRIDAKIAHLKKKDPKKYQKLNSSDLKESKYFISKNSEMSYAFYEHSVILLKMNESEVVFCTQRQLAFKNYTFTDPLSMMIRIVEDTNLPATHEGKHVYKGLIHALNENDKKAVRVFVNDVFFKDVNERKAAENAEYAARNGGEAPPEPSDDEEV